MNKNFILVSIVIASCFLFGCRQKTQSGNITSEKVALQENDGKVSIAFDFSKKSFEEGEAICLKISVKNGTSDTISIVDYPTKNLSLFDSNMQALAKFLRADFPKPPKITLVPGDVSEEEINLTGFFENLGPGMLAVGRYKIKTSVKYFAGEQIRLKTEGLAISDFAEFSVERAKGENKKAFEDYKVAMSGMDGLSAAIGKRDLNLSDETKRKLDAIAERYPKTPLGMRILIDDLGIWYRDVGIGRFAKFMDEVKPECPCCLHRWVIDRMIQRYVLIDEREKILDIAEKGLKDFKEGTPVGDYLRKAFAFRMEGGKLVR